MANIQGLGQGNVALYGSDDLVEWTHLSDFGAPEAAPGTWECPDLFPLPVDGNDRDIKWVLKINHVHFGEGPGCSRYFVGDFDGQSFSNAIPTVNRVVADGDPVYAEVTYNDIPPEDGRRILIGWLRQDPHPERCWSGAQSLPRVLSLHRNTAGGYELRQRTIRELASLRHEPLAIAQDWTTNLHDQPGQEPQIVGSELEIDATFTLGGSGELGFRLARRSGRSHRPAPRVAYDQDVRELSIDPGNGKRISLPLIPHGRSLHLHIFIDRSILEVYGGQGEAVISAWLADEDCCAGVTPYARGNDTELDHISAWPLDSIWSCQLTERTMD
jgi:fructan beta-fructosidase